MKKIKKAAIVCCSDRAGNPDNIKRLKEKFSEQGLEIVLGNSICTNNMGKISDGEVCAEELNGFYRDDSIDAIFDISGGDIANRILPYIDYEAIKASDKLFFGYSDLSVVLNAIYTKTGKKSVLYQVMGITQPGGEERADRLMAYLNGENRELFDFDYIHIRGGGFEGITVGGNIRCFLKLAGTRYFPDCRDKILIIEGLGGTPCQVGAYMNQLRQMGVFEKIRGILVGTFVRAEKEGNMNLIFDIVKKYSGDTLPIAYSPRIGHKPDSKAVMIGDFLRIIL